MKWDLNKRRFQLKNYTIETFHLSIRNKENRKHNYYA